MQSCVEFERQGWGSTFLLVPHLPSKIDSTCCTGGAQFNDTLDDFQRRARAQERLERLIRVILLFSRLRVALLEWYDETCKKRYAPGGPGEADAAEEFAGAALGQKRPRDEAGPSQ